MGVEGVDREGLRLRSLLGDLYGDDTGFWSGAGLVAMLEGLVKGLLETGGSGCERAEGAGAGDVSPGRSVTSLVGEDAKTLARALIEGEDLP